jgi:hypothetical protein
MEDVSRDIEGDTEVYAGPHSLLVVTTTPWGVAFQYAHRGLVVKLDKKGVEGLMEQLEWWLEGQ